MAAQRALVAIDIGTTAIRAGVLTLTGEALAFEKCATPTSRLADGSIEHDAEELWLAVAAVIRRAVETIDATTRIEGIGLASVGEAGVPVDASGNPLRRIIAWHDPRAAPQSRELEASLGADLIYQITGHAPDPHFAACKLLWIRRHEPEVFRRMHRWLSMADYVVTRLCSAQATVPSLASRTMLYNQAKQAWSTVVADAVGIGLERLPPVLEGGVATGQLTAEASRAIGLPAGMPIVNAGHDHLCGALAARRGSARAVDSTGSSEVVIQPTSTYQSRGITRGGHIACYSDVVPAAWVRSARVGLSGVIVEWVRHELFGDIGADEMFAAIADVRKPSGLVAYPTFGRSITPRRDSGSTTGAIVGLTTSHDRAAVLHGILESTCYSLRANLDFLEVDGRVLVEGGAARSPRWLQLKADVTGRVIETADLEEATLRGVAILAGVGARCYRDAITGARAAILLNPKVFEPDPALHTEYDRIYKQVFLALPDALAGVSEALEDAGATT